MNTFKILATLILVSIIGMALIIGPLPDTTDGRGTPGQQSPAEPGMAMEGPSSLVALVLILGTVVLAVRVRASANYDYY